MPCFAYFWLIIEDIAKHLKSKHTKNQAYYVAPSLQKGNDQNQANKSDKIQ